MTPILTTILTALGLFIALIFYLEFYFGLFSSHFRELREMKENDAIRAEQERDAVLRATKRLELKKTRTSKDK